MLLAQTAVSQPLPCAKRHKPEGVAAALRSARVRDPIGHHVHTALAILYVLLLPLATTPKDFAWALLLGWTVIRLPHIWPCYAALFRNRLMWLLGAWAVWHAVSILWSADRVEGLEELGACRVILTPLMLWPVLDRAPWLIGALLVGVFGQNLVQAGQGLEIFGLSPSGSQRLPGLIHPIQTGAFCVAAVCWHLSAVIRCKGWIRWLSVAGLIVATAGLVYSGSRGPWIAAAVAVPLALVMMGIRRPWARRAVLVATIVGLLGAATTWLIADDFIRSRVNQAITNLQSAGDGKYDTDVGRRLWWWSGAWAAFADAPLTGAGAGGYRKAIEKLGYGQLSPSDHHAHSIYLHQLATTGALGGLILLAVVGLSLRRSFLDPPDHLYADGTLFVLVSWLIGGVFDAYHLNGHMFGLFTFIVALTLCHRAAIRYNITANDTNESTQS